MKTLRKSTGLTHAKLRRGYAKVALRKFVGCVGPYRDPPTYLRSREPEDLRANPRSICSKKRWVVRVSAPKATGNGCVMSSRPPVEATTTADRVRLPNRCEQGIQCALADHLRARTQPNVYSFHPANGGHRTGVEGAILKACGVRAGTPDIICNGRTFGLKTTHGRLSHAQRVPQDEMRQAGAAVAVAIGLDDAIAQLERWQLLLGSVR